MVRAIYQDACMQHESGMPETSDKHTYAGRQLDCDGNEGPKEQYLNAWVGIPQNSSAFMQDQWAQSSATLMYLQQGSLKCCALCCWSSSVAGRGGKAP